tara:strand:+ start:1359 stop:1628 length:270 start_codon:yes stop_codon:yes gene_type:complete
MKTIVDNAANTSKYLVADDYSVVVSAENIEMGDPSNLDFIIGDLNSSNSTVIEGVTTPDDWFGCKYNCAADGTWSLVEGWVDPREEEAA